MEMKNCKKCGKVFAAGLGERICPECREKEDEYFKLVKEYIYDNPNASIIEISENTGVEEDIILRFIKEGRIEIAEIKGVSLTCEKCGKAITSGKYCITCQQKLINSLNGVNKNMSGSSRRFDENETDGPKMYSQEIRKKD